MEDNEAHNSALGVDQSKSAQTHSTGNNQGKAVEEYQGQDSGIDGNKKYRGLMNNILGESSQGETIEKL